MNEQNPVIPPIEAAPVPAYKDRSTGLIVFGILTLLLGCFIGLLMPLVLFGQMMAAKAPGAPPVNSATLLPALAIYGILAVALIWLGIGSIKARRWARALLLIFSWSWVIMGIFMTAIMPFVMARSFANLPANAKTGQPAMPPATITGMIVGTVLFFGIFFVIVPAVWTFFYSSRHVKATCEARDPVTRWTDACPLPVLAFCLWTWLAVPLMLVMPFTGHAVMPFFGMFISGLAGLGVLSGHRRHLGHGRLVVIPARIAGLVAHPVALVVFMMSGVLTYARHDITELYQLQGYTQAQIDQIQKIGLMTGNRMSWMMVLITLPFAGYLCSSRGICTKPEAIA